MSNDERAAQLGRKHCRLGRIPYPNMPACYYQAYAEEIDLL